MEEGQRRNREGLQLWLRYSLETRFTLVGTDRCVESTDSCGCSCRWNRGKPASTEKRQRSVAALFGRIEATATH